MRKIDSTTLAASQAAWDAKQAAKRERDEARQARADAYVHVEVSIEGGIA